MFHLVCTHQDNDLVCSILWHIYPTLDYQKVQQHWSISSQTMHTHLKTQSDVGEVCHLHISEENRWPRRFNERLANKHWPKQHHSGIRGAAAVAFKVRVPFLHTLTEPTSGRVRRRLSRTSLCECEVWCVEQITAFQAHIQSGKSLDMSRVYFHGYSHDKKRCKLGSNVENVRCVSKFCDKNIRAGDIWRIITFWSNLNVRSICILPALRVKQSLCQLKIIMFNHTVPATEHGCTSELCASTYCLDKERSG